MSKVVSLFSATNDARHWAAKDVLAQGMKELESGNIKQDSRLLIIHIEKDTDKVGFVQNGLCSFSIVGLLEVAKLHIFNKFIAKD